MTAAICQLGWTPLQGERYFSDATSMVPCSEGAVYWLREAGRAYWHRWTAA